MKGTPSGVATAKTDMPEKTFARLFNRRLHKI